MGLAGNIERPGSMVSWVLPETGLIEDVFLELPLTDEMKSKIIGIDRFKLGAARTCNPDTMVKKILSGEAPIHVWISVGGQQIVHMANTKEVAAAIEKVPFMAHVDLFMGPMAEVSDIVLPAAHWLEMDDIYDMHPRFFISAHNKAVEPPGEAKPDAWIFNELGKRCAPEHWFHTVKDLLDYEVRKGKGGAMKWKDFSEQAGERLLGQGSGLLQVQDRLLERGRRFPDRNRKIRIQVQAAGGIGIRRSSGLQGTGGESLQHSRTL